MGDATELAVESIVLNEGDQQLVWVAARLLMAQKPGQGREDAMEQLVEHYREDLAEAHPGVDAETLKELAVNFGGALLLGMERRAAGADDHKIETLRFNSASQQDRPRVFEVIRQMLADLNPRH